MWDRQYNNDREFLQGSVNGITSQQTRWHRRRGRHLPRIGIHALAPLRSVTLNEFVLVCTMFQRARAHAFRQGDIWRQACIPCCVPQVQRLGQSLMHILTRCALQHSTSTPFHRRQQNSSTSVPRVGGLLLSPSVSSLPSASSLEALDGARISSSGTKSSPTSVRSSDGQRSATGSPASASLGPVLNNNNTRVEPVLNNTRVHDCL